jgi:hypothetical protein
LLSNLIPAEAGLRSAMVKLKSMLVIRLNRIAYDKTLAAPDAMRRIRDELGAFHGVFDAPRRGVAELLLNRTARHAPGGFLGDRAPTACGVAVRSDRDAVVRRGHDERATRRPTTAVGCGQRDRLRVRNKPLEVPPGCVGFIAAVGDNQ